MSVDVETLHPDGLGPWSTLLRLTETADRLHHLADAAEERGRIADATRAVLAEGKVLGQLLSLGVTGDREVSYAEDADALERAVAALVKRSPAAGDLIAAELESRGRDAYAGKLRGLVARVRLHQADRQEIEHAER